MDFDLLKGKFSIMEAKQLNPLTLAYIGDGIYEIFIRTYLVEKNRDMLVNKLHNKSITYVKAKAQSSYMRLLLNELNEDEISIYKRGRNVKSSSVPKNADVVEYRVATGFESLIGYLYLTEQEKRLNEILNKILIYHEED